MSPNNNSAKFISTNKDHKNYAEYVKSRNDFVNYNKFKNKEGVFYILYIKYIRITLKELVNTVIYLKDKLEIYKIRTTLLEEIISETKNDYEQLEQYIKYLDKLDEDGIIEIYRQIINSSYKKNNTKEYFKAFKNYQNSTEVNFEKLYPTYIKPILSRLVKSIRDLKNKLLINRIKNIILEETMLEKRNYQKYMELMQALNNFSKNNLIDLYKKTNFGLLFDRDFENFSRYNNNTNKSENFNKLYDKYIKSTLSELVESVRYLKMELK